MKVFSIVLLLALSFMAANLHADDSEITIDSSSDITIESDDSSEIDTSVPSSDDLSTSLEDDSIDF